MRRPLIISASVLAGAGVFFGGQALLSPSEPESNLVTVESAFDPATQYQGVCAIVSPPDPDPCDAVDGHLRYMALGALSRGTYHSKWIAANPGEVSRLSSIMAAPGCSVPSNPQPQIMNTQYGAGLSAIVQAIACARHPESVSWPPLPPAPDPARADKTPPSAPGPVQVGP